VRWPRDIAEAKDIQDRLKDKVRIIPLQKTPRTVAGVDATFFEDKIIGVACLYGYPEPNLIKETYAIKKTPFPYIPGYLSFREGPVIIMALKGLEIRPDIILFDGHGIAHQRGMGIATHIGIILGIPSIGCAKSRLIGDYKEPGPKKGDWSSIKYEGKVVGAVLRTKDNIRPIFVSPGHRIDLRDSIKVVLGCTTKYRIPEPLRRADHISKRIKRFIEESGRYPIAIPSIENGLR